MYTMFLFMSLVLDSVGNISFSPAMEIFYILKQINIILKFEKNFEIFLSREKTVKIKNKEKNEKYVRSK